MPRSSSKRSSGAKRRLVSRTPISRLMKPRAWRSPSTAASCCSGSPTTLTFTVALRRSGESFTSLMLAIVTRGSLRSRMMIWLISWRSWAATRSTRCVPMALFSPSASPFQRQEVGEQGVGCLLHVRLVQPQAEPGRHVGGDVGRQGEAVDGVKRAVGPQLDRTPTGGVRLDRGHHAQAPALAGDGAGPGGDGLGQGFPHHVLDPDLSAQEDVVHYHRFDR